MCMFISVWWVEGMAVLVMRFPSIRLGTECGENYLDHSEVVSCHLLIHKLINSV